MSIVPPATRLSLAAPPLPAPGARWAVLLDVDGTLLDFVDDPREVVVTPSMTALLADLHGLLGGALALVSGRTLDDLDRIFGRTRWAAAGLHGLQLRHADGSFRRKELPPQQQSRMRDAVAALAARFAGVELEDKQAAIALHCRRDAGALRALHDAARELLPSLRGYELQPGHEVLEFKPADMDKGRAVHELLGYAPFAGRRPVYLGDDLTDEHAFATINRAHGVSVRIGDREPTQARYSLPGPAAAEAWLHRVLDALVHGASPHARLCDTPPQRQP